METVFVCVMFGCIYVWFLANLVVILNLSAVRAKDPIPIINTSNMLKAKWIVLPFTVNDGIVGVQ